MRIINKIEYPPSSTQEATFNKLGILEEGMVSGKTSVAIVLTDADGKHMIAQCGADQFLTCAAAVLGAIHRFEGPGAAELHKMVFMGKRDN